jgi:hypothetical protein
VFGLGVQYDASRSFFHCRAIEIQDEADPQRGDAQIRQHLGVVNWRKSFDAFHFDNDLIRDDQVGTMFGYVMTFVVHGKAALSLE